jgi:crotonobetainyl-CoA:carnitine CoA-transferase CaiB-like acyl-CoA transferase
VQIEAPNEFIMYTLPPWRGLTTTYAALNANCRSVRLNLKQESDRDLAWRLVETADVMLENFRAGAIDRMGFGFAAVAERNPSIVFCSSSGFGREGTIRTSRPFRGSPPSMAAVKEPASACAITA